MWRLLSHLKCCYRVTGTLKVLWTRRKPKLMHRWVNCLFLARSSSCTVFVYTTSMVYALYTLYSRDANYLNYTKTSRVALSHCSSKNKKDPYSTVPVATHWTFMYWRGTGCLLAMASGRYTITVFQLPILRVVNKVLTINLLTHCCIY